MRRGCSSGLTLVETMVAGTVVMLVLLALLGTIAFGLAGTQNAEGHQKAVYYAQQLLELTRERGLARKTTTGNTLGFQDSENSRVPLNAAPFSGEFEGAERYTRRIVTRRLSNDPADYDYKLFEIEVTVFWTVKNRENHFRLVGVDRAP
ncbi:MAG: hypothetical protein WC423_25705 [Vulcanimicrobiota bacterium]